MKRIFVTIAAALILFVSAGISQAVTFAWDNTSNQPGEVVGYNLYFSDGTTVYNKNVPGEGSTQVTIEDEYFTPGVPFTVYVTAYNSRGESVNSASIMYTAPSYTPPEDNLPALIYIPAPPSGVQRI